MENLFFLSPKWGDANIGQCLSSSVQSLPTCSTPFHLWKKKVPWCWGVWKHSACMFEGGNLLNLNLTPVTNIPWKPCNLTSCVIQLQSHFCQYQSDLFIIFERTVCNLHLPTTIRRHVQHSMCTHKKRVQTWNLFFKKKSIVFAWS